MSNQSQYEQLIKAMYAKAYRRIDEHFVHALDALNIPHIFGNVIADLPKYAHHELIKQIIKCSLRDLKKYELAGIYLLTSRATNLSSDMLVGDFFIVTKQPLPSSLINSNQLLNKWRLEGGELTANVKVIFSDEANYLIRKDGCFNGKCEVEHKTGLRCKANQCICWPALAQRQGFQLLFIDPNANY